MILVTGGAGYIGSHTVVELISNGYEVLIVDSLYNSDISVLDAIEKVSGVRVAFEKIDLRDKSALLALASKYEITSVIHFAAFKAVKESKENPLKYYENNILGLVNILYLMKECACKQLIFSSSCTVYGEVDKVPVDEHFPIQKPFSPYGNTKKICEEIIEDCVVHFYLLGAERNMSHFHITVEDRKNIEYGVELIEGHNSSSIF